jgi:hypothetical protein
MEESLHIYPGHNRPDFPMHAWEEPLTHAVRASYTNPSISAWDGTRSRKIRIPGYTDCSTGLRESSQPWAPHGVPPAPWFLRRSCPSTLRCFTGFVPNTYKTRVNRYTIVVSQISRLTGDECSRSHHSRRQRHGRAATTSY